MNQRDKDTLLRAAAIVKGLNDRDSQWLNEMEDGLVALSNTADTLERIKKKQNRVTAIINQLPLPQKSDLAALRSQQVPEQEALCQHEWEFRENVKTDVCRKCQSYRDEVT